MVVVVVVNAMPRLFYPWKRDPVPIVKGAEWASGPVWMGAKISPPLGFVPQTVQKKLTVTKPKLWPQNRLSQIDLGSGKGLIR